METPGAFRQQGGAGAQRVHRCKNCGGVFPHRKRGGNVFHSDECRSSYDDNARHVLHRIPTRREFIGVSTQALLSLASNLESRPSTPNAKRYRNWKELHELDHLLSVRSPNDPEVRVHVRARADAIRLSFEFEKPTNLEVLYQYFRALEILRDVGAGSPKDIKKLREYGWAVVQFYRDVKDFPKLGEALQVFANTCRLDADKRTARHMTRYAYHILKEKCDPRDVSVARLLHQSILWDLRLFGEDSREETVTMRCKRENSVQLAGQVGTEKIWLETRGALAGYWIMRAKYDLAEEELQQLEQLQRTIPDLPSYGAPTRLRPKIERLLSTRRQKDEDEGICLIEQVYAGFYWKDLHDHYHGHLQRWSKRFGLSLHLPRPTYTSPILIYLPRGDRD